MSVCVCVSETDTETERKGRKEEESEGGREGRGIGYRRQENDFFPSGNSAASESWLIH